ncbi:MAG: hypothetical protein NZ843_06170 [Fimbriimonadales bacterium]|nr:hypothetical protein [Fimbriimonadales bacterium]
MIAHPAPIQRWQLTQERLYYVLGAPMKSIWTVSLDGRRKG